MNRFCFRIRFEGDLLRDGQGVADRKEAREAMGRFLRELPACLAELGASAQLAHVPRGQDTALRLMVSTVLDWETAYLAMVGFAVRHELRATLVRKGLPGTGAFVPLEIAPRNRLGVLLRPGLAPDAGRRSLSCS